MVGGVSKQGEKLGAFLQEVSNWDWSEFVRAERDKQYSSNQAIIFALVRACSMQQLQAIKVAISRLDGKLKTPVKIEYPKVFYLYPNATPDKEQETPLITPEVAEDNVVREIVPLTEDQLTERSFNAQDEVINDRDLPSMGMRETLSMMSDYPRDLPEAIIDLADKTHLWVQGKGEEPSEIPKVKSVVAAHLLIMAQNRNIDAITEVFDQIDGKLVETLQVIGDDLYITSYASEAPAEARLNDKGVLQVEATAVQNMWAQKLGEKL